MREVNKETIWREKQSKESECVSHGLLVYKVIQFLNTFLDILYPFTFHLTTLLHSPSFVYMSASRLATRTLRLKLSILRFWQGVRI